MLEALLDKIGAFIASRLQKHTSGYVPYTASDPITLRRTLQPGDVLLVEGNQKLSAAIKYLTQSTWSHAAIYVGDVGLFDDKTGEPLTLIEANLGEGVVVSPLSKYATYNTRICRPVGLTVADRQTIVDFASVASALSTIQEHTGSGALSVSHTAGANTLASSHAGVRLRRQYA